MGYYTFFKLELLNATEKQEAEIATSLATAVRGVNIEYKYVYEVFDDSYKWYEYEEDMLELSKKYPDIGFRLWGEGEEWDDKWVLYARDGSVVKEYATITYADPPAEFNFDLLE